jgi:hypothetical protein
MSDDPEDEIAPADKRARQIDRNEEPARQRGQGERAREPESSEDEEGEDNDGGPPSSRRH